MFIKNAFYLFLVLLWRSGFRCVLPVPVLLRDDVFAFSAEVEVNVAVRRVCVQNFCLLYCTALGAFYCFGVCHGWWFCFIVGGRLSLLLLLFREVVSHNPNP